MSRAAPLRRRVRDLYARYRPILRFVMDPTSASAFEQGLDLNSFYPLSLHIKQHNLTSSFRFTKSHAHVPSQCIGIAYR